jgi:acyl-lipid omega-6 desaturase (Delta-12 desaturase)
MTVDEYRQAPFWQRAGYRLYRHPLVMFGLGPVWVFLVKQRLPRSGSGARERLSVHLTNLALVVVFGLLALTVGIRATLLVQLPIIALGGAAGIWLFYVQHQFEDAYWERGKKRDYLKVALEGSSFYDLPRVLRWFSGNIGFHHLHHLSPRIPNYLLAKCFREQPLLQPATRLTLSSSLRSLRHRLYDEALGRMVGFRAA